MYHKHTVVPLDIPVTPLGDYNSLPELLIDKANYFASIGKSYYTIDAVTREVRLFSKFDEETRKIASAFYKLGLRKGDMVIFMPSEMIKLHIFLAGIWRTNGVCRATYPEDDAATLRERLEEGDCKFILCDHNGIATCKEAIVGIPWPVEIILMEKHSELKSLQQFLDEDDGLACPALNVGKEDPALILCTSGTTETKPNFLCSKGTHISGSTFPFSLLITGKSAIITGKISNDIIMKRVHELKPGLVFAFPTFLLALVSPEANDYDVTSIEIIWSGGATITPAVRDALLQLPNATDFINTYGLSENSTVTSSAFLSSATESERSGPRTIRGIMIRMNYFVKICSGGVIIEAFMNTLDLPAFATGTTYSETYIQVRDIETLEVLGPNKSGEICIKGPALFKEYYKNPDATKAAFVDGFFQTGDIGHFDEHGYVYITDRLKEIFKYFNNHISPSEIEAIVGQHPNVSDVCVVGTSDPNGGGDVPRAFIIVKGNPRTEIAEEIRKFANGKLPDYKHLRGGVYIISELPKGKTGKVTRRLVAKLQPETF